MTWNHEMWSKVFKQWNTCLMYSFSQYRHEPVSHYGRFGTGLTVAQIAPPTHGQLIICFTYFLDKQYQTRSFISMSYFITISINIEQQKFGESSRPPPNW